MPEEPLPPSADPAVHDPDGELVRRAAEGDGRAWQALVDRHLGLVHALATRLLGSRAEAEDVAQETFLRAWRHIDRWRPGQARWGTWLCRVALNLCRDRLRRPRPLALDEELADSHPSPVAGLQAEAVAVQVRAALDRLPERQREALVLCYYEQMSNIEAAQVMEVSVEALESLLSRARRGLRRDLAGQASDLLGEVT